MSTYEHAARRGAALLDQYEPDWRERVDPYALHLGDCHKCVLGQLYGSFTEGTYALDLEGDEVDRYGFYTEGSWAWLTRAWRKLLHA